MALARVGVRPLTAQPPMQSPRAHPLGCSKRRDWKSGPHEYPSHSKIGFGSHHGPLYSHGRRHQAQPRAGCSGNRSPERSAPQDAAGGMTPRAGHRGDQAKVSARLGDMCRRNTLARSVIVGVRAKREFMIAALQPCMTPTPALPLSGGGRQRLRIDDLAVAGRVEIEKPRLLTEAHALIEAARAGIAVRR